MLKLYNFFTLLIFISFSVPTTSLGGTEHFHYSEVKNLILNLEIINIISPHSTVDAVQQLSAIIEDEYGYYVTCQSSFFRSLKNEFCLAGLVTMYRSLRLDLMDANPPILGLTEVIIDRQGSWQNADWREEEVTIYIPYNATLFDITQFVNYQYKIPFRGTLLGRLDLIERSLKEIEKRFGISILVGSEAYSINQILFFLRTIEVAWPHLKSDACEYESLSDIKEIIIDNRNHVISFNDQGRPEKIAIVYTMQPDKLCKVIQSID